MLPECLTTKGLRLNAAGAPARALARLDRLCVPPARTLETERTSHAFALVSDPLRPLVDPSLGNESLKAALSTLQAPNSSSGPAGGPTESRPLGLGAHSAPKALSIYKAPMLKTHSAFVATLHSRTVLSFSLTEPKPTTARPSLSPATKTAVPEHQLPEAAVPSNHTVDPMRPTLERHHPTPPGVELLRYANFPGGVQAALTPVLATYDQELEKTSKLAEPGPMAAQREQVHEPQRPGRPAATLRPDPTEQLDLSKSSLVRVRSQRAQISRSARSEEDLDPEANPPIRSMASSDAFADDSSLPARTGRRTQVSEPGLSGLVDWWAREHQDGMPAPQRASEGSAESELQDLLEPEVLLALERVLGSEARRYGISVD